MGETGKKTITRVIPAHANPLVAHDGSMESCSQQDLIACKNIRIKVLMRLKIRIKVVHRVDE